MSFSSTSSPFFNGPTRVLTLFAFFACIVTGFDAWFCSSSTFQFLTLRARKLAFIGQSPLGVKKHTVVCDVCAVEQCDRYTHRAPVCILHVYATLKCTHAHCESSRCLLLLLSPSLFWERELKFCLPQVASTEAFAVYSMLRGDGQATIRGIPLRTAAVQ